jgi:hypothetical protein
MQYLYLGAEKQFDLNCPFYTTLKTYGYKLSPCASRSYGSIYTTNVIREFKKKFYWKKGKKSMFGVKVVLMAFSIQLVVTITM